MMSEEKIIAQYVEDGWGVLSLFLGGKPMNTEMETRYHLQRVWDDVLTGEQRLKLRVKVAAKYGSKSPSRGHTNA